MKNVAVFLVVIGVIILLAKKKEPDYKNYLIEKGLKTETANAMSVQELKDSYALIKASETGKKISDELRKRIVIISKKYNVFT